MSDKKLMTEADKKRIQSSQTKGGQNVGKDSFASRTQSAVDKRENKDKK